MSSVAFLPPGESVSVHADSNDATATMPHVQDDFITFVMEADRQATGFEMEIPPFVKLSVGTVLSCGMLLQFHV